MDPLKGLIEEVEQLKYELSVTIPQEIQSIVSLGDLRESSEYSSIMSRQHFISIRLEQLMHRLQSYGKIDFHSLPKDAAHIGSVVKLRNLKTNKIEYVKIVAGDISDDETYIEVTISSPMGQSLKNKKVKDEIIVKLPSGTIQYKILQIKTIHDK